MVEQGSRIDPSAAQDPNAGIDTPKQDFEADFGKALRGYMNHDPLMPETRDILRRGFSEALVKGLEGTPEERVKAVEGLLQAVEFKARNGAR